MIEIKFTGDPAETRKEMVQYLKGQPATADFSDHRSTKLDHPDNVTRQVCYEPVASDKVHNEFYIVTIVNNTLAIACTCKDFHYSIRKKRDRGDRAPIHTCKHMKQARERYRRF